MELNKKIEKELLELSDEKYRKFHAKLCPGINNIGVRAPVIKAYAKQLAKENWKEYLNSPKDEYYEETLLQGLIIGYAKEEIQVIIPYVKNFIPKINNWAICDSFCANLKITKKNLEYMWEFLQTYLKSNKEFELRFAIVMILDYYITEKYINDVLQILNNIQHEGYYVKMAVAWAISICYIKFPKETIRLIQNNKLEDFTHNKSIQKIIESYRVKEQDKQVLRKLKRI